MFKIFKNENPKWVDEVQRKREYRLNKVKKEWIEFHKLHKGKLDEEDTKGDSQPAAQQHHHGRKRGTVS